MSIRTVSNQEFTATAIRLANHARIDLLIVQYLFIIDGTPSHPAPRIAAALRAAADRNVKVRILLNRFSHGRSAPDPRRGRPPELAHRNIDLRYHTCGVVLHTKIIIADNKYMLVGSHNLSDWCLRRSVNLSLLVVDTDAALKVLSIYNPLFHGADHAKDPGPEHPRPAGC